MKKWTTGMDVSSMLEVEECGGRFFDGDTPDDLLVILKRYGTSMIRLRLWNNPYSETGESYGAGANDLAKTIIMARRAKKLGIDWMLDIHYSDCWADPGKQWPPKAWANYTVDELEQAVYDYTRSVMTVLKEENLLPEIVAVGNELSNGLLWPLGQVPNYNNIARFVSAGINAVQKVCPGMKTMIHLDNGGNNELYRRWFDSYFAEGGVDFTYIGLSYYPFWHGTLQDLEYNMNDIAERYEKDLMVVEVSTGFTMEDYKEREGLTDAQRKGMATKPELAEKVPYDMSPEGQAKFMKDFMNVVSSVYNNHGKGFFYWEPAWLPVRGSQWATEAGVKYMKEKGPGGNEWANQALFNYDGVALQALNTIRDFDEIKNGK